MSEDLESRIRAALPGVPEDIILHQRQNWTPENFIRRILIAENMRKIEEARNSLETCTAEDFGALQGRIKGLRDANSSINAAGVQTHQK